MIGTNGSFDHMKELFALRFEADGDGYLYRSSTKAPPVRVTALERDGFLATYDRSLRRTYRLSLLAMMPIMIGGLALLVVLDPRPRTPWMWGLLFVLVAPPVAMLQWCFHAPTRKLKGRMSGLPGRSSAEARKFVWRRYSYLNSVVGVGIIGALVLREGFKHDLFSGWYRLWLVLFAATVIAAAVSAFFKWRYGREDE